MGWIFPSKEEREHYKACGERAEHNRVVRQTVTKIQNEAAAARGRGDARRSNVLLAEAARIKVANYIG